jgi:serine/threonine protein kinase
VSTRSDIYALGMVLFEMFTGRRAFDESSDRSEVPSASGIVGNVDPAVETVIRRCLDPNPARRPESALDVARALPGHARSRKTGHFRLLERLGGVLALVLGAGLAHAQSTPAEAPASAPRIWFVQQHVVSKCSREPRRHLVSGVSPRPAEWKEVHAVSGHRRG